MSALPTHGGAAELTARLAEHGHGWSTELAKAGHLVQREQVVHGRAAAGRGVPAAEMIAEVKSEQQVNVGIKTKVKSEIKPPGH